MRTRPGLAADAVSPAQGPHGQDAEPVQGGPVCDSEEGTERAGAAEDCGARHGQRKKVHPPAKRIGRTPDGDRLRGEDIEVQQLRRGGGVVGPDEHEDEEELAEGGNLQAADDLRERNALLLEGPHTEQYADREHEKLEQQGDREGNKEQRERGTARRRDHRLPEGKLQHRGRQNYASDISFLKEGSEKAEKSGSEQPSWQS